MMKTYEIQATVTYSKIIYVEADSLEEAKDAFNSMEWVDEIETETLGFELNNIEILED